MTVATEPKPGPPRTPARRRLGLRLRLWLGCIGGILVAGVGAAWVLWPLDLSSVPASGVPPSRIFLALALGTAAGIALAVWLDRGIAGRLLAMSRRLDEGKMADVPTQIGWGELGDLARAIDASIVRQRQLGWSFDELERLKGELTLAREAVERWATSERWEAPPSEEPPVREILEPLDYGLARQRDVAEQNQEAARQVRADLLACLERARESAEHAEHGFVEATAALTSVHEIQRLASDLQTNLAAVAAARAGAAPNEAWRAAATAAIDELASGASESVEHLAAGFLRVQQIGEQVHQLSNRATLIALHTLLTGARPDESPEVAEGLHAELKQLAIEVRGATSHVVALSHELEREIQAASERMRGIRERVALRLEPIPETAPELAPGDDARGLLERLREMAQDAARKSERVTSSTEHASRAAQDIVRRLEEESADLEGVIVRLSPSSGTARSGAGAGPAQHPTGLKVVERRLAPGESQSRGEGEIA